MSGVFKVQKLTQTNSLLKTQTTKSKKNLKKDSAGQVILSFSTIPILKYSSHALIEILSSFFDNTQTLPSYHQIQKALKIVSLTENDDILFSDIESLISKNMHKKKDFYTFFCLWCQYLSVSAVIQKFNNPKTKEKIIYTTLFVYLSEFSSGIKWYQNLSFKDQIAQLLSIKLLQNSKIIEEIDAQMSYLRIQNSKHFQSVVMKLISLTSCCQSIKISTQFQKMLANFLKNTKNLQFLDQLSQKFVSNQQQIKSINIIQQLIHYFTQYNLKEGTQIIKNSINKSLSKKFNIESNQTFINFAQEIFQKSIQKKQQNYFYEALKNWFTSLNQNILWQFFNKNFQFKTKVPSQIQKNQIIQKRNLLFQVFSQLSKQNQKMEKQVQRIIFSQYIFQFFEGKPFNFGIQSQFLQKKAETRFENEREIMIKVLKQIKNERFLNVMTFNKSSFPAVIDWQVNPSLKQMSKKYSTLSSLKKLINQVNEYWEKLEEQMLRENKKIELIFSVLKITVDKNTIFVTVSQLTELLKQIYQGKDIKFSRMNLLHYRNQYQPVQGKQEFKKNKSILVSKQQQMHPIIMQAKIVKLLKKTLKKATILQISKSLNLDKEKIHQAVKKLVNRGFLEQNQDQTYSYEP